MDLLVIFIAAALVLLARAAKVSMHELIIVNPQQSSCHVHSIAGTCQVVLVLWSQRGIIAASFIASIYSFHSNILVSLEVSQPEYQ